MLTLAVGAAGRSRPVESAVSHVLRQPALKAGCVSARLGALCYPGKRHREENIMLFDELLEVEPKSTARPSTGPVPVHS
jgi:hypothetical protein